MSLCPACVEAHYKLWREMRWQCEQPGGPLGRSGVFGNESPTNASHVATRKLAVRKHEVNFLDSRSERSEHQVNLRRSQKKRLSSKADSQ